MDIKKKTKKSNLSQPTNSKSKSTGSFGLNDYSECFDGGIVLDLPNIFGYKVR